MADPANAATPTPGAIPLPPLIYGPEDVPLDQFDTVASTPEEWRRLIEQMRGTMGPQALRKPGETLAPPPGMLPKVPPVQQDPTGFEQQGIAPTETMTPGGAEGADIFNNAASMAARTLEPGNRRAILRGALGTAGTAAGFAAGGPPGGMLGMFTGDYAGQVAANWLDAAYGSDAPQQAKPALAERMVRDMKESATDTVIGQAAGLALPVVWQVARHPSRIFNRLMKLPPNSAQFLREARSIGVDIGVANLTGTSGLGGGAMNVFSRLPFLGTKARDIAKTQARQLVAAHNTMFGKVAPGGRTLNEISAAAYEEGSRRFEKLAVKLQGRMEHAAKVGEAAGPILDSAPIKDAVKNIQKAAFKQYGGISPKALPPTMRPVLDIINKWPDKVTTLDVKNMGVWITNNAKAEGNLQYPALKELRDAINKSYDTSSHPAAKLMKEADKAIVDGLQTLSGDMAKKFGIKARHQYDGLIYQPGDAINADNIANLLEKVRTPNQVGQIRDELGADVVQAMGRMRLDEAWAAGTGMTETTVGGMLPRKQLEFDVKKFNQALGFDNMASQRAAATEEMLKGTGVGIKDLRMLAEAAHHAANAPLGDVSTFVMRASVLRGGLGGLTQGLKHAFALSVMGGSTMAATAAGGVATGGSLATAIILRTITNAALGKLMEPKLVEILTKSLAPEATAQMRIAALMHLFETRPNLVIDANAP